MLRTLGSLELDSRRLRRGKMLILLAYLALEGPKPRRFLAELFWPEAADPMNSLKVTVHRLRKTDTLFADEEKAWVRLECDVLELREHLRSGRLAEAIHLYKGPFLDGIDGEAGEELEDWLFSTRETIAREVRWGMLELAEREAGTGKFAEAAAWAEAAYGLVGAPFAEPEELLRLYPLLVAGGNPLSETVRREAAELGLNLSLTPEAARGRLRQSFMGRERELEKLSGLEPGEWAWVRGGAGMGKTALLRRLESGATYLPARSGLPYATLEPLLGSQITRSESELLRVLAGKAGTWLLDGWQRMDPESRDLLTRLRNLRSGAKVIVASRHKAPFETEVSIELRPFSKAELKPLAGAWEATGGIPALVGAFLRGESLEGVLESRLDALSKTGRVVFAALTLLPNPDPSTVRRALNQSSAETAQALEELMGAGLIEPSGAVRTPALASAWVRQNPSLETDLLRRLAPLLPDLGAFPLYQRARSLVGTDELPGMRRSYLAWSRELLRRGFPQKAAELLGELPPDPELSLLRARALERLGRYLEALSVLEGVPETAEVASLTGALYWRLGRPEQAKAMAEQALKGSLEARAEAQNTLGNLARAKGNLKEAASRFKRSASLWYALGEQNRYVAALGNEAVAQSEMGEDATEVYRQLLEAAKDDLVTQAICWLNIGISYWEKHRLIEAETAYKQALAVAEEAGALAQVARALDSLGALYFEQGRKAEAEERYEQAMALAAKIGESRLTGNLMANLAQLREDLEALEEAILYLEHTGHGDRADIFRMILQDLRSKKATAGSEAKRS